ncbi:MAG TPA: cation:proton antiporter [Balneolales bacterium]|nr:cation:proton antiporter [Balneolales bacterium]
MEWFIPMIILLVGSILVLAIFIKASFKALGIPALVGYILIGFLLRLIDVEWGILKNGGNQIFDFLANLGIIALLFRVGLENKLGRLIKWLPKAVYIWIGDITISGLLGFIVAHQLLKWSLIHSLFIAVAFTATSIGISIYIWQEAKVVNTPLGEILLDVAELDDISGIILMALLFAVAPVIYNGGLNVWPVVAHTLILFLLKLILFTGICIVIAQYLERHISKLLRRLHAAGSAMLVVVGIGLVVAATAGLLGFSVAIGAFFAGLIFSSDPDAVKYDASFESLHDMFVPFFFVGIGLRVEHAALTASIIPFLILLIAAVFGKVIGSGVPTALIVGTSSAILLGISMIPRAEIALIILQRGMDLGEWAVSKRMFADVVLISATTAIVIPVILRKMLYRRRGKLKKLEGA